MHSFAPVDEDESGSGAPRCTRGLLRQPCLTNKAFREPRCPRRFRTHFSHRRPTRCRIASDRADWLVRDQHASKSTLIGFGGELVSVGNPMVLFLWETHKTGLYFGPVSPVQHREYLLLFVRIHSEGADRRDNPIVAS